MENPRHISSAATGRRFAGPQGTQLFSAEELSRLAAEVGPVSDGRASAREPVLEGVGGGQRFVLHAGRQTIGRRGDNDIVLIDPSVSSAHAWIINQQSHYVVMNTLSTNGTFVNGKRVHEATIKHGDRVRFGQAEFVFLTREPRAHRRQGVMVAVAVLAVAGLAALGWWLMLRHA
jgi:hypothetical protein